MKDSAIPRFFEKSRKERLEAIKNFSDLSDEEISTIVNPNGGISFEKADKMVENAIGTFSLPLGVATNFKINGNDYVVPMVIEEPSVIAAASKGSLGNALNPANIIKTINGVHCQISASNTPAMAVDALPNIE